MLHELRRMLDKDETLNGEDLRRAAAVALERQFLFSDKNRDQRHFHQILDAEDYYRNLFDAFNLDLVCDRTAGYLGVLPRESQLTLGLDTEHSMFLLVLRVIYEQAARECRIGEYSQAFTDSEVLVDTFVAHTRRKRPGLVRLREILRTFSRQGLLEIDEDEDKAIRFRIRPSIRDLVTPGFLLALEDYLEAPETEEQDAEPAGGNNEDVD
ncbi:hypothetical protein GMLC_00560 [Geomonas limicola]|uniref:DUF4194 domain-containing protein n=1 Tax=Geomonas limicola TaxID=2740186 RepID=A0A6V8N3N1_9BACT|nr:DUF4194 domain-containing protein [Geomonas limicola]GFO66477.1 hypothetical protein GMLC_00560 [Geomonas limicola]